MGKYERVSVSKDLLKIKSLIGKPKKIKPREELDEIFAQLRGLGERIDKVEVELRKKKQTPKILKKKKQAIFFLKQKGSLTSSQLSTLLKISRSRANEYLKDMEREGIVKGVLKGKKKFYGLVK